MKVSPSTIEDNLYPFIFCKLPRQVLKQVGPVRCHHDEIPRRVPCRLGFHQGEFCHPPGSMPPDMPSHDRAGRHATAPLSPGEFSSAFSRKPRQPHRVRQFHPRTGQPSRGNRNPARGSPVPNLNSHGAHHPPVHESQEPFLIFAVTGKPGTESITPRHHEFLRLGDPGARSNGKISPPLRGRESDTCSSCT
jgi:hypothetical protein